MYLQLKLHCCFFYLQKKKLWKNEGLRDSFEVGRHLLEMVKLSLLFYFTCEVLHLEEIGGYFREQVWWYPRIRIFLPKHNLIFLLFLEIQNRHFAMFWTQLPASHVAAEAKKISHSALYLFASFKNISTNSEYQIHNSVFLWKVRFPLNCIMGEGIWRKNATGKRFP